MFEEEVRQSFAAQGAAMAAQINKRAAEDYDQACKNWAANVAVSTAKKKPAAPVAAKAVREVVVFEPAFSLTFETTTDPVSTVAPESYLAKHGTDIGAIGGPVGGLIQGTTDQYYLASTETSTPAVNTRFVSDAGDTYCWHQPTPFQGFWKREA